MVKIHFQIHSIPKLFLIFLLAQTASAGVPCSCAVTSKNANPQTTCLPSATGTRDVGKVTVRDNGSFFVILYASGITANCLDSKGNPQVIQAPKGKFQCDVNGSDCNYSGAIGFPNNCGGRFSVSLNNMNLDSSCSDTLRIIASAGDGKTPGTPIQPQPAGGPPSTRLNSGSGSTGTATGNQP
jgi:hypothetical protein